MPNNDKSNKTAYSAKTIFHAEEKATEVDSQNTVPQPPSSFYKELKEAVAKRAEQMKLEEDLSNNKWPRF